MNILQRKKVEMSLMANLRENLIVVELPVCFRGIEGITILPGFIQYAILHIIFLIR